jgi:hypothetical protein
MIIIPFTGKDTGVLKESALFSKIIQFSTEVKFLGLTLYKGHVWKNVMTETKGVALGIHHGVKPHDHLCCHWLVAKGKA